MAKKVKKINRSARYQEMKKLVDTTKTYSLEEAVALTKATAKVKFDATVEIHARLGIDPSKGDQQIRSTASLPHGTGKKIRIAAIVPEDKIAEVKAAGAYLVGAGELAEEIAKTGKTDFDVLITTPEMMKEMAKLAKILGPKGLMPNPKTETVTANPAKAVKEISAGKVSFKNDDTGNIHVAVGKASFDEAKLVENIKAFISILQKTKPETSKGTFIKHLFLTTSMGPSIKFNV